MDESDDDLDVFEESIDETKQKPMRNQKIPNGPYDEAIEISQDLSMAESYDGREKVYGVCYKVHSICIGHES
jgi:hypothetical protein